MDITIIVEVVLWLVLISLAVAIYFSESLITSLALLAIVSLCSASLFLSMAAPDVAMTEAAIGASISTLFILAAFKILGTSTSGKRKSFSVAAVFCSLLFLAMLKVIADMPAYGDAESAANTGVASYYIENTNQDIGIPAVVTATLASYRGYDTLGETFVILIAGLAVLMILPPAKRKKA